VTVGLNPSWREFDNDGAKLDRFPTIMVDAKPDDETYLKALSEYFTADTTD
jgi:hypothetical protein